MWSRSAVADGRRAERATAERDDPGVGTVEQGEDRLLLALAEGRLALAVEERLDRLAERLLELRVGVERRAAELRRRLARSARLAGAHEADEHQRAAGAQPSPAPAQRLHPMRSS